MPPKAQDALIEAMQEGQVTIEGITYPLPRPFMVIATQNPFDYEGTFPFSMAQQDRFSLSLRMGYPDPAAERQMLSQTHLSGWVMGEKDPIEHLRPLLTASDILAARQIIASVPTASEIIRYVWDLVEATRSEQQGDIEVGLSPRAALHLVWFSRAHALLVRGDTKVLPDDVKAMFVPVGAHRVRLRHGAHMNFVSAAHVLEGVLQRVPAPDWANVGRRR